MDKDAAREIIRAAFRSGSELERLVPLLKAQCTADEFKHLVRQVAMAIDHINTTLIDDVFKRFPELEAEVEANIARTGRAMP
jgi:hypothetical protein